MEEQCAEQRRDEGSREEGRSEDGRREEEKEQRREREEYSDPDVSQSIAKYAQSAVDLRWEIKRSPS